MVFVTLLLLWHVAKPVYLQFMINHIKTFPNPNLLQCDSTKNTKRAEMRELFLANQGCDMSHCIYILCCRGEVDSLS